MLTTRLALAAALAAVGLTSPSGATCAPSTIAHSTTTPCAAAAVGSSCEFACAPGYHAIGQHVCQKHQALQADGRTVTVETSFYGGRCDRLCADSAKPCGGGLVPLRVNATDASGPCLSTTCLTEDAALRNLARGNYEVWRRARNPKSGVTTDHIDLRFPAQRDWNQGATGPTGIGLIFEVVGDAMGWATRVQAQQRVTTTLQTMSGLTPGITIAKIRGFFPVFFDCLSGKGNAASVSPMSSGLFMQGALFAKTFYEQNDPGSASTKRISELALGLFDSCKYDELLCDTAVNGTISWDPEHGTGVPFCAVVNADASPGCTGVNYPAKKDGFYNYDEEMYTVALAYQACAAKGGGTCGSNAVNAMWKSWQGRRMHPNHEYKGHKLLSMWSGYIVHLVYYTTSAFNSDATYTSLFKSHWQADWTFFNSSSNYAGLRGRYGLGAGVTAAWCSGLPAAKQTTYLADRLDNPQSPSCRNYSPYVVAGYLPAAPAQIKQQLLQLLEDGESVLAVPNSTWHVLWRKPLLDPSFNSHLTMVDFSSELFGLSTLWTEPSFFQKYTKHTYVKSDDESAAGGGKKLTSFRPGQVWKDTSSDVIRAHSGGVMLDPISKLYYWYGSDGYPGGDATLNVKINVYSSKDLYNWKPEGVAFTMPSRAACEGPTSPSGENITCYADRCKVLFAKASKQWVMWCKSKPFLSISVSSSPTGPFKMLAGEKGLFLPGGHEVGDCTAHTLGDQSYFVLSVHPSSYGLSPPNQTRQVKIFKTTADLQGIVAGSAANATQPWPIPNKYDGKLEAPALFVDSKFPSGEKFYIWASHCTYWFANDAYVLSSDSMSSGKFWKPEGNPTRNDSSFQTQSTDVILPPAASTPSASSTGGGIEGLRWIYIADRFEPYITQNTTGRYVWLPMTTGAGGKLSVEWHDEWQL